MTEFNPEGKTVEVRIDYIVDRSIEIHLDGGAVIQLKPTVQKVEQYMDQWDPEGNPIFKIVHGPNIINVSVPFEMKKKPN